MRNLKRVLWVHNYPESRKSIGPFIESSRRINSDDFRITEYRIPLFKEGIRKYIISSFRLIGNAGNYDIIHFQTGGFVSLMSFFIGGIKIISLRGSDFYRYFSLIYFRESIKSIINTTATRLVLRRVNGIIVMSESMYDLLPTKQKSIAQVIPDRSDKIFSQKNNLKPGYQNELKVLVNSLNLDNPVKNLQELQLFLNRFEEEFPELIKVTYLSNTPYELMPDLYKDKHVIILNSKHEGWPNCIKEALLSEVPFLSKDVSDLAKVASIDSANKIFRNYNEFKTGLLELRNDWKAPVESKKYVENFKGELKDVYEKFI